MAKKIVQGVTDFPGAHGQNLNPDLIPNAHPYAKFVTYKSQLQPWLKDPNFANAHIAFQAGKGYRLAPNAARGYAGGVTDYGGGMVAGGTPAHAAAAAAAAASAGAAGAGATPVAPAPAAPARPLSLAERAAQIAGLGIDPQIAALQRADQSSALAWADAAKTAHGFDYIPQIQSAYQQAADSIAGYSQGLTGDLRDTQMAAAQDAANRVSQLGLPADASTVPTNAAQIANTNYYLGGVLPSADLATQAAQSVTGTATRQMATEAALADQASAAHFKTLQDIADVEAKRPELIATTMQNMQNQGLEQQKFDEGVREFNQTQATAAQNAKTATAAQLATNKLNMMKFAWSKAIDLRNQGRQDEAMNIQKDMYLLSQAKNAQQYAVAASNLTGQLYTVDKKGNVVPTGQAAPGSTAGQVQSRADIAAADRRVKQQIANAANSASKYRADTAAASAATVAGINKSAKIAAAQASARIKAAAAKNKPPSTKDQLAVFKGADASGGSLVNTRVGRIKKLMGAQFDKQGYSETDQHYQERIAAATETFKNRLTEHRDEMVAAVHNEIQDKLMLLKYTPEQIDAYADSIVSAYIPLNPSPTWAPPGVKGVTGK